MSNKPTKKRLTLELRPEAFDRLTELEQLVDAESKASVLRQALQLYEHVARELNAGSTFHIKRSDGSSAELLLLPSPIAN